MKLSVVIDPKCLQTCPINLFWFRPHLFKDTKLSFLIFSGHPNIREETPGDVCMYIVRKASDQEIFIRSLE